MFKWGSEITQHTILRVWNMAQLSDLSYSVWELCSCSNIRAANTNLQYLLYPCMEENIIYYLFKQRQLKDKFFHLTDIETNRNSAM